MLLFMWVGMAEAAQFFARSLPAELVCYTDRLFAATYYFSTSQNSLRKANIQLANYSYFFNTFFWTPSLILNIFVCYDLVSMIAYPFKNREGRVKYYFMLAYLISFFCGKI